MKQLNVKNFALFKDQTSFDFSPLTFLIGSNGSGKSSLVKLLNLLEHNNRFHAVDKYDLSNYESQVFNSKKPFEISFEVAENLYCKKKVSLVHDDHYDGIDYHEKSLSYLNENGDDLLTTLPILIESAPGIRITLDIAKFYEVLTDNNLEEFKNKLLLSDIPERKLTKDLVAKNAIWDEKNFEIWFFKSALYEFFQFHSNISNVISNEEFNGVIHQLFKPFFELEKKPWSTKERRIKLDVIRLWDIGEPKKVFTSDDVFGKTLAGLYNSEIYPPMLIHPMGFVDDWVKEFFGKDAKFEFKKLDKKYDFFEATLNGKDMPEQGTGVFRMLHLICKLSLFGGDDFSMFFKPNKKDDNDKVYFVRRNFLVIEEPETNLHPDYQVKLAEMIFDLTSRLNTLDAPNNLGKESNLSQKFKSNIIVETHSEYMIRMMQYLVAKNKGWNTHVGIINFGSEENLGKIKQIKIKANGSLTDNFYSGFFNYSENLRLMIDALNTNRAN